MKQRIMIRLTGMMLMAAVLFMYSCAAREDKAETAPSADQAMMDSVYAEQGPGLGLEASQPDKEQLEVFVQRAEQKLKDLGDYISIITDKSYEQEFRNEARKQALELFGDTITADHTFDAEQVLNDLYKQYENVKVILQFNDVKVSQFPEAVNEKLYIGKLSFLSSVKYAGDARPGEAIIIIKKVSKQFGNETREVWEVMLGEIRLNNEI